MQRADLRSYVARSRAILETTPPDATREIRAWLVEPLLSALGWDVRSAACETDATVRRRTIDYLLSVDGTPAVAVLVRPASASLEGDDSRLRELMAATGIDRGIETDGRTLLLYAGADGSDRFRCPLESVRENADALSHFSESRCRRRLERRSRALAARRLAVRRGALSSAIAAELADVAGERYAGEFETAASRFVDDLVDSLAEGSLPESALDHGRAPEPPTVNATSELADEASSEPDATDSRERHDDANRVSESDGSNSTSDPSGSRATAETSVSNGPDESPSSTSVQAVDDDGADSSGVLEDGPAPGAPRPAANDRPPESSERSVDPPVSPAHRSGGSTNEEDGAGSADDDGEFVVRFFNEHGSIGAIGFSRSADALVGAAEFCLERGLSGVRLPWGHDDVTVLNDKPVRVDGSPMSAPRKLSNGYVLEIAGDEAARAERIEALASRAGLRVMLTGDWKTDT